MTKFINIDVINRTQSNNKDFIKGNYNNSFPAYKSTTYTMGDKLIALDLNISYYFPLTNYGSTYGGGIPRILPWLKFNKNAYLDENDHNSLITKTSFLPPITTKYSIPDIAFYDWYDLPYLDAWEFIQNKNPYGIKDYIYKYNYDTVAYYRMIPEWDLTGNINGYVNNALAAYYDGGSYEYISTKSGNNFIRKQDIFSKLVHDYSPVYKLDTNDFKICLDFTPCVVPLLQKLPRKFSSGAGSRLSYINSNYGFNTISLSYSFGSAVQDISEYYYGYPKDLNHIMVLTMLLNGHMVLNKIEYTYSPNVNLMWSTNRITGYRTTSDYSSELLYINSNFEKNTILFYLVNGDPDGHYTSLKTPIINLYGELFRNHYIPVVYGTKVPSLIEAIKYPLIVKDAYTKCNLYWYVEVISCLNVNTDGMASAVNLKDFKLFIECKRDGVPMTTLGNITSYYANMDNNVIASEINSKHSEQVKSKVHWIARIPILPAEVENSTTLEFTDIRSDMIILKINIFSLKQPLTLNGHTITNKAEVLRFYEADFYIPFLYTTYYNTY